MNVRADWSRIRQVFKRARRSGLHHAFATVNPDGTPQITPIGSLWLHPTEPRGIYVEIFNRQLAVNLNEAQRVSILAVDAHYSMWLRALLRGRFTRPPGVRLNGSVGPRRRAQPGEIDNIRKMFRSARFTRGYTKLWSKMEWLRDIEFDGAYPVRIGAMTAGLDAQAPNAYSQPEQ